MWGLCACGLCECGLCVCGLCVCGSCEWQTNVVASKLETPAVGDARDPSQLQLYLLRVTWLQ